MCLECCFKTSCLLFVSSHGWYHYYCFMVMVTINIASWLWSSLLLLFCGCDYHQYYFMVMVAIIVVTSWSWSPSILLFLNHGHHHYCYFLVMVTIVAITSWSWSPSLLLFHGRGRLLPSLLLLLLLKQGTFPYPILCRCGVSNVEHEVALASTTFT